ncbi:ROK family protein [Tessaracoccus sp. OS52]|uniref:ROK family transcriptional regulator n=1 Tax=Tessaracoccus sp. OS52 TaxID=2886691 RepID=UPI001D1037BD|nr:ROK family transcriptional regulator [Tessaracoccus sp. OS52]MCC2592096.1 ROK family protein [Tessaracoccus sp. OS52]
MSEVEPAAPAATLRRRSRPTSSLRSQQPGARQSDLRERNLSLVFRQVLACAEPPSRADVAALTGLTRSTVSRLVDELLGSGMLQELEALGTGRAGRPALPLVANGGTMHALGLELNVSHMAVFVMDLDGTVLASGSREGDYSHSSPIEVLDELADLARSALERAADGRLVGAALAVPGLVDSSRGVLLRAPNLGWVDVGVGEILRGFLSLPDDVLLLVGNEADFAAETVAMEAPGRPSTMGDFLYISGETGIGSSAVIGTGVVAGRHGWAGELGHVCADPEGSVCGCGAQGCVEAFAGAKAIRDHAGVSSIEELLAAAEAEEPAALEALRRAGDALGIGVSAALNLLDLPVVVIGGHLGRLARWVVPALEQQLQSRVLAHELSPPRIIPVEGEAPAALGAAMAAFRPVLGGPAAWLGKVG